MDGYIVVMVGCQSGIFFQLVNIVGYAKKQFWKLLCYVCVHDIMVKTHRYLVHVTTIYCMHKFMGVLDLEHKVNS